MMGCNLSFLGRESFLMWSMNTSIKIPNGEKETNRANTTESI
jgi:hypothetical protein